MNHVLIAMPQGAEWLVILAIVILVFGATKLPDLARSSGQALRIFRTETKSLDAEPSPEPTRPSDPSSPPRNAVLASDAQSGAPHPTRPLDS